MYTKDSVSERKPVYKLCVSRSKKICLHLNGLITCLVEAPTLSTGLFTCSVKASTRLNGLITCSVEASTRSNRLVTRSEKLNCIHSCDLSSAFYSLDLRLFYGLMACSHLGGLRQKHPLPIGNQEKVMTIQTKKTKKNKKKKEKVGVSWKFLSEIVPSKASVLTL